MDALMQDLRFALRGLAKSPGLALVVVLTLALGIGANTAIFSLLDQVLLRLLPVRDPARLVVLDAPGPFSGTSHNHSESLTPVSHRMFEALRDRNAVFAGVLAHFTALLHLSVGTETENANGDLVSGTFFEVLGLRPALGRLFTADDDRTPGGHPVVVLGHGFWTRRFAADPGVVGRMLGVNGHPMLVVGIAPPGFHGVEVGESTDVYVPIMMQREVLPTWDRGIQDWRVRWLTPMARLREGVSRAEAEAGINVLYRQLLKEDSEHLETQSQRFRDAFLAKRLALRSGARGTSGLRDQSKTALIVLMGMVGLVLLIACANVANLLLARASARYKEIAIRLALGASRGRLLRQLLVESLLLSLTGGALGLVLATFTAELLVGALPYEQAARSLSAEPDLRMELFALGLSLVTAVGFGLAPALQSTRPELSPALRNEAVARLQGVTPMRFRQGLVVAQVALSLLVLVGAGLFARSLRNLRTLDPGFAPEHVLAFSIDPSLNGYPVARRLALMKELQEKVAAEPGVRGVSMAREALMTNSDSSSTIKVEGYEAKEDENMNPNFNRVGPGFFSALGIRLVAGRDLGDTDIQGGPRVAVVNEVFARYFFGSQDPLGRRFALARRPEEPITIVGVVRDGKAASLREAPRRFVYLPYAQENDVGGMTFYARATGDPAALGERMRQLSREVDATLPVTDMKTLPAQIRESLFVERMLAALSAAFSALATLLAAVGLYGVMSYAVARRTREIGIRVALGAERRSVLEMVLKEVATLALLGVAIGLPSGFVLGRLVEAQLFGLSGRDPLTFLVATLALLTTALLAGFFPAARATRVDPMVALRCE